MGVVERLFILVEVRIMNILVFGGTRFMGRHIVSELLAKGHSVTIATRGLTKDCFGDKITRLIVDRTNSDSIAKAVAGKQFDAVIDTIAYCSNDIKALFKAVNCKRYIQISSMSVYNDLHDNILETEFDPNKKALLYCNREDFTYDEVKRQAECAIVQDFSNISSVRIRLPFVIGQDDYTKRLYFYVENTLKQKPMFIDNLDAQMAFVRSDEAGKFAASFIHNSFEGAVNGASSQTVSINEVLEYVKQKTGIEPILLNDGEAAPYNGAPNYYLNTNLAINTGFLFSPLKTWIYDLLDYYISTVE